MNKKWLPHIIAVGASVVFIVLGLASATTPTSQITLGADYQKYLRPPSGNERAIDSVGLQGRTSFVCRDPSHGITTSQVLGASYQIGGQLTSKSKADEAAAGPAPTERHRHETILDQLQSAGERLYPSETVDIRNARTTGHAPTNPRQEEYQDTVRNSDGSSSTVTRTRTVWDCYPYYSASVITTEPMPAPVSHSENFQMPGLTRNDIYRRGYNWLEDNKTSRRIGNLDGNFDRGRITGTVTFATRADHTYRITSNFTIDVYDARTEVKFDEAILQRTDPSQQSAGGSERIFLQSIADAAKAEIVDFSTSLRSYIISR
jgi:hypothetical protein